jgi:hypothetical protein
MEVQKPTLLGPLLQSVSTLDTNNINKTGITPVNDDDHPRETVTTLVIPTM